MSVTKNCHVHELLSRQYSFLFLKTSPHRPPYWIQERFPQNKVTWTKIWTAIGSWFVLVEFTKFDNDPGLLIVAVILSFGSDFFVYIKFYNSINVSYQLSKQ